MQREAPRIKRVSFSVMSDAHRERLAVREIDNPEITNRNGSVPNDNGCMSLFLGSQKLFHCKTCFGKSCGGHFGICHLAAPLFNPMLSGHVPKVLRLICFFCSASLLPEGFFEKNGNVSTRKLFKAAERAAHLKCCRQCKGIQPSYETFSGRILAKWDRAVLTKMQEEGELEEEELKFIEKHSGNRFTSQRAYEIFRDASIWRQFGLSCSFADTFCMKTLLVPPTNTRPSFAPKTKTKQHDLTKMIQTCLRLNQTCRLALEAGSDDNKIQRAVNALQQSVNAFLVKDTKGKRKTPQQSGQSLVMSLQSKQGLLRASITGKRTNNNARTVIGGDVTLDVGQLLVPERIACKMTVPMRCNDLNFDECTAMVRTGGRQLGGAEYIQKQTGGRVVNLINLNRQQTDKVCAELQVGDTLHRHLRDGDPVIFLRNPTLNKMSLLSHTIKIYKGLTFRFNQQTCGTFNADFDGDEMNLHVPQTQQARAECVHLSHITNNTLDGCGRSTFEPVQDITVAVFCATDPANTISVDDLMQLSMRVQYNAKKRDEVVSKACASVGFDGRVPAHVLLDMILPEVTFSSKGHVLVDKGWFQPGTRLNKGLIQDLYRRITLDCGDEACTRFVSDLTKSMTAYLAEVRGLTCSLSHFTVPPHAKHRIQKQVQDVREHARSFVHTEAELILALSSASTIYETSTEGCPEPTDGLPLLIHSRAKGKKFNMEQLCGCLGTQITNSKMQLPLPCRRQDDTDPCARGFIAGNYTDGLTPEEMFQHCGAGRDGLIDSALSTASAGYGQRKKQRSLEDTHCARLMTGGVGMLWRKCVLTTSAGYAPQYLEKVVLDLSTPFHNERMEELRKTLLQHKYMREGGCRFVLDEDFEKRARFCLPVDGGHLLRGFLDDANDTEDAEDADDTEDAEDADDTVTLTSNEVQEHVSEFCKIELQRFGATQALELHLLLTCTRHELTPKILNDFLTAVEKKFHRALFIHGQNCGAEAAGESSRQQTQSFLDSFHNTGQDVVGGAARDRELVETSQKTSRVEVRARDEDLSRDLVAMKLMAARLVHVTLGNLVKEFDIVDDLPQDICFDLAEPQPSGSNANGNTTTMHCVARLNLLALRRHQISSAQLVQKIVSTTIATNIACTPLNPAAARSSEPILVFTLKSSSRLEAKRQVSTLLEEESFGLFGVRSVVVKQARNDFYFQIVCTDLRPILMQGDFDLTTLRCNNPVSVAQYFGVEMAYSTLLRELASNSPSVSEQWMQLIAMVMSKSGHILPVTFHGANKSHQKDTLGMATFERPRSVFADASLYQESSTPYSRSAAVILSQQRGGTATVHTLPNTSAQPVWKPSRQTNKQPNDEQKALSDTAKESHPSRGVSPSPAETDGARRFFDNTYRNNITAPPNPRQHALELIRVYTRFRLAYYKENLSAVEQRRHDLEKHRQASERKRREEEEQRCLARSREQKHVLEMARRKHRSKETAQRLKSETKQLLAQRQRQRELLKEERAEKRRIRAELRAQKKEETEKKREARRKRQIQHKKRTSKLFPGSGSGSATQDKRPKRHKRPKRSILFAPPKFAQHAQAHHTTTKKKILFQAGGIVF